MNEKVENLILEHLRVMRTDIASLKEEMVGMRSEMRAMKQHMAGFMTDETRQDGEIAELKLRLDRIEKRLELSE
ncbi:hypothetical protein J5J10_06625 [Ciceribacter sp. L1K23]|uniref:hypothetical protein n=1 Tax=unclassified Ciceribacter TaxID=2628820 RepID=UPI001ABE8918|nr:MULTISPECIES: hypothetical protein [unclassified Ciceribacter]MBO3760590.1 hypothetical protein [Ciceribacter sp. L1K22]MBR0555351.1 hypothetical protein [Ciceribacter sp. L1K23]